MRRGAEAMRSPRRGSWGAGGVTGGSQVSREGPRQPGGLTSRRGRGPVSSLMGQRRRGGPGRGLGPFSAPRSGSSFSCGGGAGQGSQVRPPRSPSGIQEGLPTHKKGNQVSAEDPPHLIPSGETEAHTSLGVRGEETEASGGPQNPPEPLPWRENGHGDTLVPSPDAWVPPGGRVRAEQSSKASTAKGGGIWGYFWGEVRVPWGWEEHFGVPPEQRGGPITLRGGRGRRRRLRAAARGGRGGRRRRGLDRGRGRPLQGGPQRPPPTGSSRLCARRETSERVGQFQGEGDVDLEGEQMQEGPPPRGAQLAEGSPPTPREGTQGEPPKAKQCRKDPGVWATPPETRPKHPGATWLPTNAPPPTPNLSILVQTGLHPAPGWPGEPEPCACLSFPSRRIRVAEERGVEGMAGARWEVTGRHWGG